MERVKFIFDKHSEVFLHTVQHGRLDSAYNKIIFLNFSFHSFNTWILMSDLAYQY